MSGSNNVTVAYVDLSTFDTIENLLYAGADAANIFHARITKCIWFGQIPIRLRHSGTRNFNETFYFTQPRQGDYATYTYARITLPALAPSAGETVAWCDDIGHAIFKDLEFSVNDIPIQKYTQLYLEHRAHHSVDESHWSLYQNMIGNKATLTTPAASIAQDTILVPLWAFYQKAGAAFPHSCIPYADVKWEFTLRPLNELLQGSETGISDVISDNPSLVNFELWTNYVVLTQQLRTLMGTVPRQMVIEQVNDTSATMVVNSGETNVDLRFSYHMTWLAFVAQNTGRTNTSADGAGVYGTQITNYTDNKNGAGANPISNATILYENSQRLDAMPADYYSFIVPFFHFEAAPRKTGFHTWSLAYYGNSYNPTGGINVSRMFNMSAKVVSTAATAGGSFKLLFIAQVKTIVTFSGGAIVLEFH